MKIIFEKFKTGNPFFDSFLLGQLLSQIGENTSKVALPWLAFSMASPHHAPIFLSFLFVSLSLPPLLFGWIYGEILDRAVGRRLGLLFVADACRGTIFLAIPVLFWAGVLSFPLLVGLLFLATVFSGFFGPAMVSAIPEFDESAGPLVKRNALVNMTGHVGLLAGPILGGALSSFFPPAFVVLVTAVTFLLSAGFIARSLGPFFFSRKFFRGIFDVGRELMTSVFSKSSVSLACRNTFCSLSRQSHTSLFAGLSLLVGGSLGLVVSGIPVYVREHLSGGPFLLGIVMTAAGLGMLLASGFLGRTNATFGRPAEHHDLTLAEKVLSGSLFLSGLLLVPTCIINNIGLILLLTFVAAGLADVYNPILQTEIQQLVGSDRVGRTMTSLGSFFLVGFVGSTLSFPFVTEKLGLYWVFALAGILRLVAGLFPLAVGAIRQHTQELSLQ